MRLVSSLVEAARLMRPESQYSSYEHAWAKIELHAGSHLKSQVFSLKFALRRSDVDWRRLSVGRQMTDRDKRTGKHFFILVDGKYAVDGVIHSS